MTDIRQLLLRAEHIVEGPDFNRVASELRAAHPQRSGYEVVLAPETSVETLSQDLVPRLRQHLEAKSTTDPRGVMVSLWFGDRAHIFFADRLLAHLSAPLGPRLLN